MPKREKWQIAVCCHNLKLCALSSRSALCVLVGALFKKFGLFLNTPRIPFNSTVYYATALDGILLFISNLTTKRNPPFKDPVPTAQ
jgi:hypothetical protein